MNVFNVLNVMNSGCVGLEKLNWPWLSGIGQDIRSMSGMGGTSGTVTRQGRWHGRAVNRPGGGR
ncbi:hypothetical protein [Streptomyces sp. NPDC091219]|uniref:hypothetical protein n=1 Tax=Streptomyces sp. NPDC091219 TaxID=3155193 RepID=UPI00344E8D4E